jgi:S1-C subfamily serine protease
MKRYFRLTFIPLVTIVFLSLAACGGAAQFEPAASLMDQLGGSFDDKIAAVAPGSTPILSPATIAAADGQLATIYGEVSPSVVHIQVINSAAELPADHVEVPDLPDMTPPAFGEGSGFVWDNEGHIVTNNHVVSDAEKIMVLFADDTAVEAELVGADPDSDLAVISVEVSKSQLQPVRLGDSMNLQVGELAIAIGNPFGQEGTMTAGIISALGRLLPIEGTNPLAPRYNIPDVIQTDAAINPGNSGGVLLNGQGEVIGVTTAIISASRASSGIGFAVPAAIVKQVVPALIADGRYDHPFLGIRGGTLSNELAEALDLPDGQRGVLVAEVIADGPAEEAGLKGSDEQIEIDGLPVEAGGDIIIAADGQSIEGMDDMIAFLERHTQVGQSIELTILRDGEEEEISVKLSARPERKSAPFPQETSRPDDEEAQGVWLGITAVELDSSLAEALELPAEVEGIVIQQVVHGSPAHSAGLKGGYMPLESDGLQILAGGDVILTIDDTTIMDLETLQDTLNQYEAGDEITLRILREAEETEVVITLTDRPE